MNNLVSLEKTEKPRAWGDDISSRPTCLEYKKSILILQKKEYTDKFSYIEEPCFQCFPIHWYLVKLYGVGTGDSRQYLMEGDPNISTCLHVPQDFFIFPPVSRKCETEPPGCICVNDCSEGFKFLLPVFFPHFRSASQPLSEKSQTFLGKYALFFWILIVKQVIKFLKLSSESTLERSVFLVCLIGSCRWTSIKSSKMHIETSEIPFQFSIQCCSHN